MKKKIIIFILMAILAGTIMSCGTEKANTNVENTKEQNKDNKEADSSDNNTEDFFDWLTSDTIQGLSEVGKKQEKIIIPEKCKQIVGTLITKDSDVKEIEFAGKMTSDFVTSYITESGSPVEKIEYPEGMEELASTSLYSLDKLKDIEFPSTLKKISDYSISSCNSIEKVDLSNTETEYIGSYAFQDCNSLKEIYLPKTIKEIGQYAFPKSVTDIYVPEEAELITFAEDNVLLANETAVRIHVKEGSWADNNFDNWFNKDPKYTKVYD